MLSTEHLHFHTLPLSNEQSTGCLHGSCQVPHPGRFLTGRTEDVIYLGTRMLSSFICKEHTELLLRVYESKRNLEKVCHYNGKISLWTVQRNGSSEEEAAIFPCCFTEQNCVSADGSLIFCAMTVVEGEKKSLKLKNNPQHQQEWDAFFSV